MRQDVTKVNRCGSQIVRQDLEKVVKRMRKMLNICGHCGIADTSSVFGHTLQLLYFWYLHPSFACWCGVRARYPAVHFYSNISLCPWIRHIISFLFTFCRVLHREGEPVQIHSQKKRLCYLSMGHDYELFESIFFSAPVEHKEPTRWKSKNKNNFSSVDAFSLTPFPCWNIFSSLFWLFGSVRCTYDTCICILWQRSTTIREDVFILRKKKNLRSVWPETQSGCCRIFLRIRFFFFVHINIYKVVSLFFAFVISRTDWEHWRIVCVAHEDWWWRQ